jgi:heme oxygenase
MPPGALRTYLRHATAQAHARVDALLASGFADVADYAAYLRAMHSFVRSLVQAGVAPSLQSRLARLQDDMALLRLDALPVTASSTPPDHPAGRLAWEYVFEGSSLGARVLVRRAAELGYIDGRGASFLSAHAASAAWPALLQRMEALQPGPDELDRIGAAGRAAFEAIEAALRIALHTNPEPVT